MCPRCKHGPIEHFKCSALTTHFGESQGSWMTDNRCEVCRFFSTQASDWPRYDSKASCEAQGYLGQLHKDVKDAVDVIEKLLQDLSWYMLADKWLWSLDLSHQVTNLLIARSSLIIFFVDSLRSYNPLAHRGDKNHSRDTLNAEWSQNDCRAQLVMQSMNIRYKISPRLDGYDLVFRICSIVQSTAKALTPRQIDIVKKIVTQSTKYKNLPSVVQIQTFLEPVEQLISLQCKAVPFLAKHASCFSTRIAVETAFILLSSGCFVIEDSGSDILKLNASKSCPLHEAVAALKSCGTGLTPLHVLTLLAHSLQPSIALETISRSKEEMDVELVRIVRRLVKGYCHSGAVASSELMGGRILMESMAAASQLMESTAAAPQIAMTTSATSPQIAMPTSAESELLDDGAASESSSDGTSDSDYHESDED